MIDGLIGIWRRMSSPVTNKERKRRAPAGGGASIWGEAATAWKRWLRCVDLGRSGEPVPGGAASISGGAASQRPAAPRRSGEEQRAGAASIWGGAASRLPAALCRSGEERRWRVERSGRCSGWETEEWWSMSKSWTRVSRLSVKEW